MKIRLKHTSIPLKRATESLQVATQSRPGQHMTSPVGMLIHINTPTLMLRIRKEAAV